MQELWLPVPGYEEYYKVSNFGRVRSLGGRIGNWNEKILKPNIKWDGYHYIRLNKNKKVAEINLHRLVASIFITNPEGKTQINHIDADKSNNKVDNLEWCTPKENIKHAIMMGLHPGRPPIRKDISQAMIDAGYPVFAGMTTTKEGKRLWAKYRYELKKSNRWR